MTTTKGSLIEKVFQEIDMTKKASADIVEAVFEIIKETLETGEKITISGFGRFVVREKKARKVRNPRTGEGMDLAARRVLTFKPSQILRDKISGDEGRNR